MKSFMLVILFFVGIACAQTQKPIPSESAPITIMQGEVRWFEFPVPKEEVKLLCHNKEIKFVRSGNLGQTFVMESYFSKLKPFKCKVLANEKVIAEYPFIVKERDYFAEQLKVDPKKIKLSIEAEKRVIAEQVILNRIYDSSVPRFLFSEAFMAPLNSVVTSVYGNRRVYNKKKKGQHLGIDYRAAIGDKIPAANSGKVVFAGDLFYTGWTVIIDHGLDIFTVYGHLSKTLATQGDMVKKGDLIGLSGNTGRTSGPHLHWGTKVQGEYVDGFVLIEESKKKFHK